MLAYNVKFVYRGEVCTLCMIGDRAQTDLAVNDLESGKALGVACKIKSIEPLVVMAQGEC